MNLLCVQSQLKFLQVLLMGLAILVLSPHPRGWAQDNSGQASTWSWQALHLNNEGAKLLEEYFKEQSEKAQKKATGVEDTGSEMSQIDIFDAYKSFISALAKDPFNPVVRLNLGLTFEANKEESNAIKEFEAVERMARQHLELQFLARYNKARVLAATGNIDGALKAYQSALEIQPDSKEVKTNIELLWQMQGQKGEGGDSSNKDQDDSQSKNGESGKEPTNDPNEGTPQNQKKKTKPKPFESQELTPNDVRKILEEIKNQEQKIRAKEYSKGLKERSNDKDW